LTSLETFNVGCASSRTLVEFRSHEWPEPMHADRACEDHAFIDLCLTLRPTPARGRYIERWPAGRFEPIGMILFIPPGMTLEGTCGAGRQRSLSCFIDASNFDGRLGDLSDRALLECLDIRNADVLHDMHRLSREIDQPSFVSPVLKDALVITLSADLLRHLCAIGEADGGASGLAPWRMRLIEERIRSPEPLPRVAELAALCKMSTRHLARAFKSETGATVRERIKAAGLARAQQMLTEGRVPIKQIAAQLGFASTSSFSSAYMRATGDRPKDTRARSGCGSSSRH